MTIQKQKVKPKRIPYLDTAKGIGMICVILGHMGVNAINMVVFSFHMPLFFFLSGYFIKRKKSWKELIPDKFNHLVVPYLFTGVAVTVIAMLEAALRGKSVLAEFYHWGAATLFGSGSLHSYFFDIQPLGAVWFLLAMFWSLIFFNWIYDKKYRWLWAAGFFAVGYGVTQILYLPWSILSGMTAVLFLEIGHASRGGVHYSAYMVNM